MPPIAHAFVITGILLICRFVPKREWMSSTIVLVLLDLLSLRLEPVFRSIAHGTDPGFLWHAVLFWGGLAWLYCLVMACSPLLSREEQLAIRNGAAPRGRA